MPQTLTFTNYLEQMMRVRKRTFNEILNDTKEENCSRLMDKARAANQIAKQSRPRSRRKAYGVKHGALTTIVKKMKGKVDVKKDFRNDELVVVTLRKETCGLHMPLSELVRVA